jgi:hypothetical protein
MIYTLFFYSFLLFILYIVYRYISWRYKLYTYQKRGIPIAYSYFYHPLLPFATYFGKKSPKEQERLILETFKQTNSPFVLTASGNFFSLLCGYFTFNSNSVNMKLFMIFALKNQNLMKNQLKTTLSLMLMVQMFSPPWGMSGSINDYFSIQFFHKILI